MEHQEPLSANVAKAIITKCMANINTLRMQSEEYMIALAVALDRAVLGQLFQSVLSRSPPLSIYPRWANLDILYKLSYNFNEQVCKNSNYIQKERHSKRIDKSQHRRHISLEHITSKG